MNPYVTRALGAVALLGIMAIWVESRPTGRRTGTARATRSASRCSSSRSGRRRDPPRLADTDARARPDLAAAGAPSRRPRLFVPLAALGNGDIGGLQTGGWLGVAACGLFLAAGIVNALLALAPAATRAPSLPTAAPGTAALTARRATRVEAGARGLGSSAGWYPDPNGEARLRYWAAKNGLRTPPPDLALLLGWRRKTAARAALSRPSVMGVVNVTPDSFFDGGANFAPADAVATAQEMVEDGAAIVDVGGESTRPGSEGISAEEELSRVVPVLEALDDGVPISIDTSKAVVARRALALGVEMVNDVTALRGDPELAGSSPTRAPTCA